MKNGGVTFEAVGPQIRMHLPSLTPTEMHVADTILNRDAFTAQTSIKEVADEAGVSEALVVKVSKKLGFAGFRELRTGLVGYRKATTAGLYSELSPDDGLETIAQKVFNTSIQALEETLAILDTDALLDAVSTLFSARNVDLYGVGGSAQIAGDVSHKFLRIGKRYSVYDDPHMMMMSASVLEPGDVVVAFSHSGTSEAVIEACELARSNGAKVIASTNYTNSPLSEIAEIVLVSTSQGGLWLGENSAARIAQLNLFDVIYVALAQRFSDEAERNLGRTMAAVQSKRRKR